MIKIKPKMVLVYPEEVIADYCEVGPFSLHPGGDASDGTKPNGGASASVRLGKAIDDPAFQPDPEDPDAPVPQVFVNLLGGDITEAMTDEQFAGWGLDNEYAVDCILANRGLVRV